MSMHGKEGMLVKLTRDYLNRNKELAQAMAHLFLRVYPLNILLDEVKGDDDDHTILAMIVILEMVSHTPN